MRVILAKVIAATLFAALAPTASAWADPAEIIVDQMNLDDQFMKGITPILPMMTDQMVAQMRGGATGLISRIENEGKGGLPKFKRIIQEEFLAAIEDKMPAFNSEIQTILRDNMSEAQLKDVAEFIKTDAGKQFFAIVYGGMQDETQRFGARIGAEAGSVAITRAMMRSEAEQF